MVSASAVPENIGGVRQSSAKQKGLGGLMLMAIGGVVVIAIIALVLGLVPENKFTNKVRDAIPGLEGNKVDGWHPVAATDGSFTAQMPGDPVNRNIPFNTAGAKMETVAVKIGSETELSVAGGSIVRQGDQSEETDNDFLERLATAWAQDSGFEIKSQKETSFAGHPARLVEQNMGKYLGKTAEQRSLFVLAGDFLYVIQSTSVYPDHPQFDRLVSTVALTQGQTPPSPPTDGS